MKKTLFALALAAGLTSFAGSAKAQVTFTYSGSIQSYYIPSTGIYEITAAGAQGGSAYNGSNLGGNGAFLDGFISLTSATLIQIVVGQAGSNSTGQAAGGGGGTFIYISPSNPLMVAGGGGGASQASGLYGQTNQSASDGMGATGGTGGSSGSGGDSQGYGAGGAGFYGAGQGTGAGYSAPTFAGGTGSNNGGYGGGGAGWNNGGGGGGGYSGGGGGGIHVGGGGGGSYTASTLTSLTASNGANTGNGYFTITAQAVPEPSTYALFGIGALALIVAYRRKSA